MKPTLEELASQYADNKNLPTKRRYIDERNDPNVCYTLMSYEVRAYVEEAFEDGFKAAESNITRIEKQRDQLLEAAKDIALMIKDVDDLMVEYGLVKNRNLMESPRFLRFMQTIQSVEGEK